MKVAFVCSNFLSISEYAKKGTEIFDYILINNLAKTLKGIDLTAFASGDSRLPIKVESIDPLPSSTDKSILQKDKHIIFELALLSKAFSMQESFDLYHINIGDGDIALPFAPFVKKPILVTLHYTQDSDYINKYFALFRHLDNVSFISISNTQRKFFPDLNYVGTIYNGVETELFQFEERGGEEVMWAGRGVVEKGLEVVFEVVKQTGKRVKLFPLKKEGHLEWLDQQIALFKDQLSSRVSFEFDKDRFKLINEYQTSKLFLFPLKWEEPFGLVLIESMACGTPVVAYARGSIPEIIKDGETGFIVNPTETDTRGDWIIKKTGVEGLCEAVEKIYSMPESEYQKMRQNCRRLIEESFSATKMAEEYAKVYKKLVNTP